jgi:hypothetical protein
MRRAYTLFRCITRYYLQGEENTDPLAEADLEEEASNPEKTELLD